MSTCVLLGCVAGVWALLSLIGSERAGREPAAPTPAPIAGPDTGGTPH